MSLIDRSLPRHSTHGARRSRAGSRASIIDPRLSIINEDGNPAPPPPVQQPHHRPFSRRFLGEPPSYRHGKEPPKYSMWDVTGPKGEKLDDIRNNRYVARRGGWKRICLIALIVTACIVALAVGLGVGLQKKHSSSFPFPSQSPSPSSSSSTGPFPAGSYNLETFLDTTTTNCTSSPSSWKCEPSITYATSPTDSMATFNWVITPSSTEPNPTFTISSTDNPFAIDFPNATLRLLGAGSEDERYTFTTTVQKVVFPSFATKCYYNDTQFTANLYTKKRKSYPPNSASASSTASAAGAATTSDGGAAGAPAGGAFADWRFAVDATQSIGGGVDVPACYSMNNGQVGARITSGYEVRPAQDFCSCAYKNYDP